MCFLIKRRQSTDFMMYRYKKFYAKLYISIFAHEKIHKNKSLYDKVTKRRV